ncbi:B-box zinc finger family protein [Prunus dulcis]|uniref:B-box zinc finger family protein n=1 Tax=Prunus dulcis TaxID=3755 RepID=A0A4Y1R298_PRUDU|nr:B-box zinc finger family protein [Prunus dulcis]
MEILDLKRLQLSQDQPNQEKSSSVHEHQNPSRSLEHSLDHHRLQHSQDDLGRTGSQQWDSCLPVQGLMVKFDPLPLPFPEQLEQYFPSSSSTAGFISKMCHTPSWRRRAMQEQPRDKLTKAISAVLESAT